MGYIISGIAPRRKRQLRSHLSQERHRKRAKSRSQSPQLLEPYHFISETGDHDQDTRSILERFPLEILHKIFVYVGVEGNNMYYMAHYFKICLKPTLKLKLDVIQEGFVSDLNERVRTPTLESRIHRLLRAYDFDQHNPLDLCKQVCLNPAHDEANPSRIAVFREAMAFSSHLRKWRYAVDSSCLQYKFVTGDVIAYIAEMYGYLASKDNIEQEVIWREQKTEKLVAEISDSLGELSTEVSLDLDEHDHLNELQDIPSECQHMLFRHKFRKGYLPQRFWNIDSDEKLAQCKQLIDIGGLFRSLDEPLQMSLKAHQAPLLDMAKTVHDNCENTFVLVYSVLNAVATYKDGEESPDLFQQVLKWYCDESDGVRSKHEIDMVWSSLMEVRNVKLTEMFMDVVSRRLGLHYGAL